MQRTLAEIDPLSGDISDRLITLQCGHIFTVETLDGHCEMSNYYQVDNMGRYVAMQAPPSGYQHLPVCPTCRGPITALRYGRVIKRAMLDIAEQNVANSMSRALAALNPQFEKLADLSTMKDTVKSISPEYDLQETASDRIRLALGEGTEPLPVAYLNNTAMHSLHGLSIKESGTWSKAIAGIIHLYGKTRTIATKHGAHTQAYEGAVTTLYRLEMDAIANDPTRWDDARAPEPAALSAVQRMVGQVPPKADTKYQIEAYFRTLELRYALADIAHARIQAIPSSDEENAATHSKLWISFVEFLYTSCEADGGKALSMATKSSASRQVARCSIQVLRAQFEKFRFQTMMRLPSLCIAGVALATLQARKNQLLGDVQAHKTHLMNVATARRSEYLQSRPVTDLAERVKEREWFKANCMAKVERFVKDLDELEESVRKGVGYQPLSMQEMQDIVKAIGFGTLGANL